MKKIFVSMISFVVLLVPMSVLALDIGTGSGSKADYLSKAQQAAGYGAATETTFASNLGMVVNIALSFAGVIFMSLLVYAGYLWMTARGEESKIDKAQSIIRSAITGLIITVGAYSITNFVVPKILERAAG